MKKQTINHAASNVTLKKLTGIVPGTFSTRRNMMKTRTTLAACSIVFLFALSTTTPAGAVPLNVDFTRFPLSGGGSGLLEPGFLPFAGNESSTLADLIVAFPNDELAGSGNSVSVTIGGYTHFRTYPEPTTPVGVQADLLGDMALRNADGTMTLTLSDLLPGPYKIKTYHHSSSFGAGTFDMELTDALVTNDPIFSSVPVSDTTTPTVISTRTFTFNSDGSPVVIDFLGGAGSFHLSLNGFELSSIFDPNAVPEPSTSLLLGIGLFGMMAQAGRRRRRR